MRRLIGICLLGAAATWAVVGCDGKTPVFEDEARPPDLIALFGQGAGNYQNAGTGCFGTEAVLYSDLVSGLNSRSDPYDVNCTSNDIEIASVIVTGVGGNSYDPDVDPPIVCVENQPLQIDMTALLASNANSFREDIGVWIATDGGDAITGACNHYNLLPGQDNTFNGDSDLCAGMAEGAQNVAVPLGTLNLTCTDPDGDGFLDVGGCLGWKIPGADEICPDDRDGNGTALQASDFRAGTLLANKSKCNCEPSLLQIQIVAELTLEKNVINDNGGGALATAWTLHADGPGTDYDLQGQTGTAAVTAVPVAPGVYTLSETGGPPSGYSTTGIWACTGDGTFTSPNQIELGSGDAATCVITNTDDPPYLKLVKTVDNNNGGTAVPNDWDLTATGEGGFTETTPATADATSTIVKAGINYALGESGPDGYTAGDWSCTGTGGTQDGANIQLALGANVTCTINNTDDPALLKLVKTVDNDNGGTAAPNDWDLTATGEGGFTETTPATADATSTAVKAGINYALSESGPDGYTAGDWSCTGTGGTQDGANIQLALGADVTCTINNTDDPPYLKLVKTVDNDNGGTAAPNDWDLTATGVGGFTETTPATANATSTIVEAGINYALSESGPDGYTAGDWSCTGTGGTQDGANIQLALGANVTCTINNTDDPALLKLVKTVDNDNGGTAVPNDWDLTATGVGGFTETTPATADATSTAVEAGINYALSESGPDGYTAGDWSCTGTGGTQDGANIQLALGADVTCTINNTDDPPYLKLVKTVDNDNGGTAVPNDWDLTATGVGGFTETTPATANATSTIVEAGINYALSESGPDGYTAGDWSCTGTGGTQDGANIQLALGADVTCTINNTDDPPHLTLTKTVVGGTALETAWTLSASGPTPISGVEGASAVTNAVVDAGTYTLSESTGPAGYETTGVWVCTGDGVFASPNMITLGLGESATCDITNTYVPQDETAWAANGNTPGSLGYEGANWATYVEYFGVEKTVSLFADQDVYVGTVTFSAVVAGKVTITVDLIATASFHDVPGNIHVQGYVDAPTVKNPSPGQFDNTGQLTAAVNYIEVDADGYDHFGVHVLVIPPAE